MQGLLNFIQRLYRDEQGAEGAEKLLIMGVIILPLLGILIFFRDEIAEWLNNIWGDVRDDNTDYRITPN